MARRLWQNFGTIVLALILAVMVWVVAQQAADPLVSRRLPASIVPRLDNLPAGMVNMAERVPPVYITLRGPRSIVERVTNDQVSVSIDLHDTGPGQHTLCVSAATSVPGVMIDPQAGIEPACIDLYLERSDRREWPIEVRVSGRAARGYQLGEPQLSIARAALQGAVPYLDRVVSVGVEVPFADARATLTQTVPVLPLDAEGHVVSGLVISPTQVTVSVPVAQLEDFKELPVTVRWAGQPAPGYTISGISIDPPTVLVTGSPAVIRDLPGYVETTPVDITDASASVLRRIALVLPLGVSLVAEQNVLVEVSIDPIQGSSTITRTVELQGLGQGYTATLSPPAVDVILTGPVAVLNALAPGDVRVIVDVFQLTPGTYTLEPRAIILPDDVRVQTVLPGTLRVTITIAPTPEPTPTPPPTPTPAPK